MFFFTQSHLDPDILALHRDLYIHVRPGQCFDDFIFDWVVKNFNWQKLIAPDYCLRQIAERVLLSISLDLKVFKDIIGSSAGLNRLQLVFEIINHFYDWEWKFFFDIISVNISELLFYLVFLSCFFVRFLLLLFFRERSSWDYLEITNMRLLEFSLVM